MGQRANDPSPPRLLTQAVRSDTRGRRDWETITILTLVYAASCDRPVVAGLVERMMQGDVNDESSAHNHGGDATGADPAGDCRLARRVAISGSNNTIQRLLECVTLEGAREHQVAFQGLADAILGRMLPGLTVSR